MASVITKSTTWTCDAPACSRERTHDGVDVPHVPYRWFSVSVEILHGHHERHACSKACLETVSHDLYGWAFAERITHGVA